MTEDQLVPLLGQGGISAALMFVLYKVGIAMVAAVKELRGEVAEHTKADLAHHAEVKEELVALRTQVDAAITWQERTPVEPIRDTKSGPVRAAPTGAGVYGIAREKTRGG